MKCLKSLMMVLVLSLTLSSNPVHAMDVRVKTVLKTAGYGLILGGLLGTASLAFGTNGRAVSQGASIGLYAGLLFGGYVIIDHQMRRKSYYQDDDQYYQQNNYDNFMPSSQNGFDLKMQRLTQKSKSLPLFQFQLVNIDF